MLSDVETSLMAKGKNFRHFRGNIAYRTMYVDGSLPRKSTALYTVGNPAHPPRPGIARLLRAGKED